MSGVHFHHAIARLPSENFAAGLTSVALGTPSFETAYRQHAAYVEALHACGLTVTVLEPEPEFPDSTFVEDTAVLFGRHAVMTRPGARSREGEVAAMRPHIEHFFDALEQIVEPGTLDGGDVCDAGDHFYIGRSHRTNDEGARQLTAFLQRAGKTATTIDIRGVEGILHLKSGMAYLGDERFAVIDALAPLLDVPRERIVRVRPEDTYAANCVRVNDRVLVAAGFPQVERDLQQAGLETLVLDMSEFQKMDGGLSCLSLRF
jgi:dimethylargininase